MVVIATSKWASGEQLHVGRLTIPTGAYLVVILVPAMVYMFFVINHHYRTVKRQLTLEGYVRPTPRLNTALVLVPALHRGTVPALQFAKSISENVRAVFVETDPAPSPADVIDRLRRGEINAQQALSELEGHS